MSWKLTELRYNVKYKTIRLVNFTNDDRHSLDSAMKIIHFLLTQISTNRATDFNPDYAIGIF